MPPGRHLADRKFRKEVARKLKDGIKKRKKWTYVKAAKELGVSRQSLSRYINAHATPSSDVICRACQILDIQIEYKGMLFGAGGFKDLSRTRQTKQIVQELLKELDDKDLKVTVWKRTKKSVELRVEVKLAS